MMLSDYLIDPTGTDWPALLKPWAWRLPATFTLWLVNRFADLFIVLDDGSVHVLLTDCGELRRLAASRDHFAELIDQDDNADDWLLVPLVDDLVASGALLTPGQCYGFKVPPVIGGGYNLSNISPRDLREYLAFLADFYEQLKDVPDGTSVTIRLERKNA
jgi:hypothetical protein